MIKLIRNAQALTLVLLILSSTSCGLNLFDDSDPGGSGGGIGGSGVTSYSVGTLTGFGSVFINGSRFDTTTADFLVNGQPSEQNQLRVGMQLTAQVDFDAASADNVSYTAALIGPVTSTPDNIGRFTVLNQAVLTGASTVFDSLTLLDIAPGRAVEVSGVTDANGNLIASYIRPATTSDILLAGSVSAVENNQQSITLRNITILLDQADISALNGDSLAPGTSVIVTASGSQYDATNNSLIASSVAPGIAIAPTENARIELTGFVQTFNSSTSFNVDGLQIATSASTKFEAVDGLTLSASAVFLNSLIEVEGRFLSTGVVEAQRIVVLPVENTELVGRIEAIDSDVKSVTVLGVTVRTTSVTRFRGDNDDTMNFDALRVGDYAEIDAAFTSTGLLATKIEIDEADEEASIEGPVTQIDANQRRIEIVGVSLVFNNETEFEIDQNGIEQEVDEQTFVNAVSIGTIVKAKWDTFSSVTVPVDELEIE